MKNLFCISMILFIGWVAKSFAQSEACVSDPFFNIELNRQKAYKAEIELDRQKAYEELDRQKAYKAKIELDRQKAYKAEEPRYDREFHFHCRSRSNYNNYFTLIKKINNITESVELPPLLKELREYHACGFDRALENEGADQRDVDSFVISQVEKFKDDCNYYWQNQIFCVWNLMHTPKHQNRKVNPPASCPKLKVAAPAVSGPTKGDSEKDTKTKSFNFSNKEYLTGIKDHGCYDESNTKTHLSRDCELLYGALNKCNYGAGIVFRGSDYAICKKYEVKRDSQGTSTR